MPGPPGRALAPSVDSSLGLKLLPTLLSVIAGSADVISFLGLGGLFVAHITGNLVLLAAHLVTGTRVGVALLLSVPLFILVLGLTKLLAAGLEAIGLASLRPQFLLQFLLLAGFLALGIAAGPHVDPNAATAILAGMLGVSAMAVQNALVQLSLRGAPSTAVMTTNITRFTMDIGEVLLRRDPEDTTGARRRAAHTWPAILGFTAGAVSARLAEAVLRDERAVLPVAAYAPRYDVTLSLVSVLGAGGVQQMHEPAMTSDERAALERSAAALREAARRVLAVGP